MNKNILSTCNKIFIPQINRVGYWGEIEVYVISFNNWFGLIWSLPWELESLTRPDLRYCLHQWSLGLWRRNTVFLPHPPHHYVFIVLFYYCNSLIFLHM